MDPEDLKKRTKAFALRCIRLYQGLKKDPAAAILGKQLLRSATSIGANYRSACKARSQSDFISKITVVEEEADESQYWIELLIDANFIKESQASSLLKESK